MRGPGCSASPGFRPRCSIRPERRGCFAARMPHPDGPSIRSILRVVTIVVVSALSLYLIWVLRKPITWIVIAGFIAIAVSAPIGWLQQHIGGRRGLAIFAVYLGLILTPVVIAAVLVPPVVEQANNLV